MKVDIWYLRRLQARQKKNRGDWQQLIMVLFAEAHACSVFL
jgi:hypothetical protein